MNVACCCWCVGRIETPLSKFLSVHGVQIIIPMIDIFIISIKKNFLEWYKLKNINKVKVTKIKSNLNWVPIPSKTAKGKTSILLFFIEITKNEKYKINIEIAIVSEEINLLQGKAKGENKNRIENNLNLLLTKLNFSKVIKKKN